MSDGRPSRFPALLLLLWLASTLFWWAFAFAPLPSAPPEWLTAARLACFGEMAGGLPEASGWILLVLAPASFLVAIAVLWGRELGASLLDVARTRAGRCVLVAVAVVVAIEAAWVVRKVDAARAVTTFSASTLDDGALPPDYPRKTAAAPAFALVDQHGATVSPAQFRGRPVLVTFVFAHCASLCPLIVETLKSVPPGPVTPEVLLVTLDPWRDTPGTLAGTARQWGLPATFHFLSARRAEDVLRVADAYGVPFERDQKTGDISHPGLVFVIDPDGRLAYTFNTPSAAWVGEALLRAGGSPSERARRDREALLPPGRPHARRG